MNVRPLIIRELRAEARRANTYWLRALAAGLMTALFVWSSWNYANAGPALGYRLFDDLSKGVLFSILIIISAITADSISREKREGTLGLLFLTPLTPRDVVIGKSLVHVLRAVGIFVAILPIVILPFLLGGINGQVLIAYGASVPAAMAIAIASGIVASVRSREWIESIVWAELLCAIFVAIYWIIEITWARMAAFPFGRWSPVAWIAVAIGIELVFAGAALMLSLWFAGWKLERVWQDEGTQNESWWVKIFSTSYFWRAAFHWDTKKARDRNPIAWLQEYNWASRLTKWGWCILIFVAQGRLMLGWRQFMDYQMELYRLVAIGIAFSAAASFRRERQTGALELLLVTPISAGKLIFGRLQGVWVHFFPAMAILACVWTMGPQFLSLPLYFAWYLIGAYLCIPIIGFYCSMLTSNVLVAWLLTLLFGQYLPYAITQAFRFDIGRHNVPFAFFVIEAVFALFAGILLYENLVKRRFVLR